MITIQKMIMKCIGIYVICHFLVQTASHEYDIQLEYERPHHVYNQKEITPSILMVDATNRLGFSILKHHTFNNHNNVAFSPCGLASVLVALFEGSEGHSSYEIFAALTTPLDRDVVRIGYRDIHRRLRSYFYQQENVLSGLSLSKENVTIRSGYEAILRFYGYDLGDGSSEGGLGTPTTSSKREQDEPETSTPMQMTVRTTEILTTTPRISSTVIPELTTEKFRSPTTQYNDNKVTEAELDTTTYIPTEKPTELPNERVTEMFTETTTQVRENILKEPAKISSIGKPTITTTIPTTTVPTETSYVPETTTLFFHTTRIPTTRFTYPPTEYTTILPVTEMVSTTSKPSHLFTFKPITTTTLPELLTKRFYSVPTTIPSLPTIRPAATDPTKLLNSLTTISVPTPIRLNPSDFSSVRLNPRSSRVSRVKKDATTYNNFVPLAPTGYGLPSDIRLYDPYFSYATPNPSDLYYPEGNPIFATKDFEYEHHDDEIDHIFYLNPHDSIRIGFKVYNTLLRFAFIPGIQASVMELPLDSDNYSLLIFVPDQPIEEMVYALCSHLSPSLTNIRAALRENWIKTMIPKFHLKGNVVLTGDLMKMGIQDIFEPNKADFSPMTDEFGIYARHVEQSITVNIRTHANNQLRRYAQQFFDPIKVPVNRPFVFVIIDNELDLAIMVGRVLNPLNSRIL